MAPASGFQGRDPELAQIRGEPERLADGQETDIIVEGAAGMSKSRDAGAADPNASVAGTKQFEIADSCDVASPRVRQSGGPLIGP